MRVVTTFASSQEYGRATSLLDSLGLPYASISPEPAYACVGSLALVLEEEDRAAFLKAGGADVVTAGWIDFREPAAPVPDAPPPHFAEDLMGRVAIVLLAPCVADYRRLRLTAHFSGDAGPAMPYLNAVSPQVSYMASVPVLSMMDGHRMLSLTRHRISIAKADDIVDAWACLERVRRQVNETWARRHSIVPSDELHRRPSALEIYKRLPGTNCRACGLPSCTAFAWGVWRGDEDVRACLPVFAGERRDLAAPLLAICAGLGLTPSGDEGA